MLHFFHPHFQGKCFSLNGFYDYILYLVFFSFLTKLKIYNNNNYNDNNNNNNNNNDNNSNNNNNKLCANCKSKISLELNIFRISTSLMLTSQNWNQGTIF